MTERTVDSAFREAWALKEAEGYRYGHDALEQVRFGWDMAMAQADRLTDALERIRELEAFICEAEPLSWAAEGYPGGTEDAHAWEKKAKALVERYPDVMRRTGMVRGPLPKVSGTNSKKGSRR